MNEPEIERTSVDEADHFDALNGASRSVVDGKSRVASILGWNDSTQEGRPNGFWKELAVLGLALVAVISIGLGWAVAQGSSSESGMDASAPRGGGSTFGARPFDFGYWSATAVPPSAERFSAVRPPSPIGDLATWPHDALAILPDPNVLDPSFAPLRLEDVEAGGVSPSMIGDGPRLAIGGLDALATSDLGRILVTRTLETELVVANVGSDDLVISRVYAGTSAIRATIDETSLDAGGYPMRPVILPEGARITMTLEIDGRRLIEHGTQAEHLQVFSNDQMHEIFDASDDSSHETRIRLVFDGRELELLQRPVSPEEIPLRDGQPRIWLPELAVEGRGGDLIDLGADLPLDEVTTKVEIRNIGSGTLTFENAAGQGVAATVVPEVLEEGGVAVLEIRLSPDESLDRGRWIRRQLTVRTNDPLMRSIELSIIGSWALEDGELEE